MTLIAGIRFQDGVVVAGDSRVTVSTTTGEVLRGWDNAQKVYDLPPFVVGISGDVETAAHLLGFYLRDVFDPAKKSWLEDQALNPEWISTCFTRLYIKAAHTAVSARSPRVGLVLASCGRNAMRVDTPPKWATGASPFGLREVAKRYYAAEVESDTLVMSLEFPEGLVRICKPGEVLIMGTGQYIDTVLSQDHAVYLGTQHASLSARAQISLTGFVSWGARDSTFNNLVHMITLDASQIHHIGSAHNASVSSVGFDIEDGGTSIPFALGDSRPELQRMQSQGQCFVETLFDGEHWWVVDYRRNTKFQLRNIVIDYCITSPQWSTARLQARFNHPYTYTTHRSDLAADSLAH